LKGRTARFAATQESRPLTSDFNEQLSQLNDLINQQTSLAGDLSGDKSGAADDPSATVASTTSSMAAAGEAAGSTTQSRGPSETTDEQLSELQGLVAHERAQRKVAEKRVNFLEVEVEQLKESHTTLASVLQNVLQQFQALYEAQQQQNQITSGGSSLSSSPPGGTLGGAGGAGADPGSGGTNDAKKIGSPMATLPTLSHPQSPSPASNALGQTVQSGSDESAATHKVMVGLIENLNKRLAAETRTRAALQDRVLLLEDRALQEDQRTLRYGRGRGGGGGSGEDSGSSNSAKRSSSPTTLQTGNPRKSATPFTPAASLMGRDGSGSGSGGSGGGSGGSGGSGGGGGGGVSGSSGSNHSNSSGGSSGGGGGSGGIGSTSSPS